MALEEASRKRLSSKGPNGVMRWSCTLQLQQGADGKACASKTLSTAQIYIQDLNHLVLILPINRQTKERLHAHFDNPFKQPFD